MKSNLLVFVINGRPGAGKDTFVETLDNLCETDNRYKKFSVHTYHSSDAAKSALRSLGWDGTKSPEIRNVLAYIVEQSNKLFDTAFSRLMHLVVGLENDKKHEKIHLLFVHERDRKNIDRIKIAFNARTIHIERGLKLNPSITNSADLNTEDYVYDIEINNTSSLQNLRFLAMSFLDKIKED